MTEMKIVEVDGRGRCSLNEIAEKGRVYRATLRDDGSVLLEPARVMTLSEVEALGEKPTLKTSEEKKAFSKEWDRRVEEGKKQAMRDHVFLGDGDYCDYQHASISKRGDKALTWSSQCGWPRDMHPESK